MNVVCTHCAHEFELTDETVAQSGGTAECPSCGEQTALGDVPSGATLPWHPGAEGMPPGPGEPAVDDAPPEAGESMADDAPPVPEESASNGMFDAAAATAAEELEQSPIKPKEQSVLFKLGGIQAMAEQSQSRPGGGPPEASGLLDIRMLAATIHQRDDLESAHKVQFVGKTPMSGPVALPTSGAALAPAPAEKKGKGGLIIAGVVFLLLIVAAVVLVYFVYAGKTSGDSSGEKQASAAEETMEPSMRVAPMDAMRPPPMVPPMDVMKPPPMEPPMDVMKPPKPKKKPRKLYRKHIKAGVATVADKVADCKKDRKGRFKLRITVVGKTGKVKRVRISGRSRRRSKTGRCLKKLFEKAQFTPFKRRRQSFTHRLRIK